MYAKKPVKVAWLVLDRSTSMQNCYRQTISAYNEYLETLKSQATECDLYVGLTIFSDPDKIEVGPLVPIAQMVALTEATYQLVGCTALNDAIARSIQAIEKAAREKGTETILFCIQTDGEENSSREFPGSKGHRAIFDMIRSRQEKNWVFTFLGADMDSFAAQEMASSLGVSASNSLGYAKVNTGDTLKRFGTVSASYLNSNQRTTKNLFDQKPDAPTVVGTSSSGS